jgi:hypothetical protein
LRLCRPDVRRWLRVDAAGAAAAFTSLPADKREEAREYFADLRAREALDDALALAA